ncbi:hypothetical protein D3C81_1337610 [compost metagenome]
MADVQLDRAFLVGRRGDGVAAALAVTQQEFHVLAGQVLHALGGGQLQADGDDVVRQALQRAHAAGNLLDGDVAGAVHFPALDGDVRGGVGAAEQRAAFGLFLRRQRRGGMVALDEAAFDHTALAGAAGAVLAAVGQADAVAQGRAEDGFIGSHLELVAAGHDGYLISHNQVYEPNSVAACGIVLLPGGSPPGPSAPADRGLR